MSKTHPINQSIAALFTPESEKLRANAKDKASTRGVGAGTRSGLTAPPKAAESSAAQDSLGNPNSPGYEMIWKGGKPKTQEAAEEERKSSDPNYVATKRTPKNFIHLQTGWEKLLIAQKKVCEKARNLWVALEAAPRYSELKKNKLLAEQKSGGASGFIVDVQSQEYMEEQAQLAQAQKDKERDDAA